MRWNLIGLDWIWLGECHTMRKGAYWSMVRVYGISMYISSIQFNSNLIWFDWIGLNLVSVTQCEKKPIRRCIYTCIYIDIPYTHRQIGSGLLPIHRPIGSFIHVYVGYRCIYTCIFIDIPYTHQRIGSLKLLSVHRRIGSYIHVYIHRYPIYTSTNRL